MEQLVGEIANPKSVSIEHWVGVSHVGLRSTLRACRIGPPSKQGALSNIDWMLGHSRRP